MSHESVLFEIHEFCDMFLPDPSDPRFVGASRQHVRTNPFTALDQANDMTEVDTCFALLEAVNHHELVPGCKAAHCESHPDLPGVDLCGRKFDVALFDKGAESSSGQLQWADQELPIKIQSRDLDPFDEKNTETDATSRKKGRRRLMYSAELLMRIQQRLSLFMFVIVGRSFRILRWDRSGVVVSKAADYVNNWELFCNILWRISLAHRFAPDLLGVDISAVRLRPSDMEWKRMTAAAESNPNDVDDKERILGDEELTELFTFKYVREAFKRTLEEGYPRYRVTVPGKDKTRDFLICRPIFQAKGLTGRGTRGYVALEYDPTPSNVRGKSRVDRFVFMKDAWRMERDGVRTEGDTLTILNGKDVQYVPTVLCHGDVGKPIQKTMNPQYWALMYSSPSCSSSPLSAAPLPSLSTSENVKGKSTDLASESSDREPEPEDQDDAHNDHGDRADSFQAGCSLQPQVHYRFVVEEVGRPLSAVGNERKLLSVIIECVEAHQQAYKLGILHCDISAGNVLVYPKVENLPDGRRVLRWVGLLTDWEMSKSVEESLGRHQKQRTGTWQFMSYGLLADDSKVVELCDDLEAFFYVILYYAVRYVNSNCEDVAAFLEDFFDSYTLYQGVYYVGEMKKLAIKCADLELINGQELSFAAAPINELVRILLRSFSAHYKILKYEESKSGISQFPIPAPPSESSVANASDIEDIFLSGRLLVQDDQHHLLINKAVDDAIKRPTEEDRILAKNALDHDLFLRAIFSALYSKAWSRSSSSWKTDSISSS